MFSKLGKILASAALFGALAFNATSAFADGEIGYGKPSKKKCHTEALKAACDTPSEMTPMPMKKECMGEGMMFGAFGDFGVGINSNSDFALGVIPAQAAPLPVTAVTLPVTFVQKRDSAYGGGIQFGWMMANSLEAFIELSYKQVQNNSTTDVFNKIESDILSGMIGANYYVDLFNGLFLPFVGVAGGISRTKASGTLEDALDQTKSNLISFDNLVKTRFCYQVNVGAATNFDNAIIGLVYKFFGHSSISDSGSDFNINVTGPAGDPETAALANPTAINFGSLKNNVHLLSVFFKFLF